MATEKVKGGYKVKLKGGGLGKTVFKTQAAAQARSRGPKPKGKGKPKGKAKGTAKTTSTGSNSPKLGALYVGGKATALVLSPLSDVVLQGDVSEAKVRAKGKEAWNVDTAKGAGVLMADTIISGSKKINHAAALSRRSLTAWAPEAYLALTALDDVRTKQSPRVIHARAVQTVSGFNPTNSTWGIPERMRVYYKTKAGGILLRKGLGTKPGKRITRLLRPTMKMLGVSV